VKSWILIRIRIVSEKSRYFGGSKWSSGGPLTLTMKAQRAQNGALEGM